MKAISIAVALTILQGCSGAGAASDRKGGGGASARDAATAGSGGTSAGGSGTAAKDASIPPGHDASTSADSGASAVIDLSGTWISDVTAEATESGPIIGATDANLELVFRLVYKKSGDTLNGTYEICKLTSVTTPNPKTLVVTFPPAVIATLKTETSQPDPLVVVGDAVPIPDITLLSGIDASGKPVDADMDSHPGVTLPTSLGGTLSLNGYIGVTVKAKFVSTLTDVDTLEGTGTVSADGLIFGSDNPLLNSGTISIVPKSDHIPFTAMRLAGDVPCSEVLTHFP